MTPLEIALYPSLLVIGLAAGFGIRMWYAKNRLHSAEEKFKEVLAEAQKEAETKKKEILLEAKDNIFNERKQMEREFNERNNELQQLQRRMIQKEDSLDKKYEGLERKEKDFALQQQEFQKKSQELQKAYERHLRELEKVAQMTAEEAKQQLLNEMVDEAKRDSIKLIKQIEEDARDEADSKAREIIVASIERNAAEVTAEKTITTVQLPNDEMKGRIIGREGRNIRAFESIAGIDLIIDDTPEVVVISSFDPYRREIAKIALERLIVDGRIHPGRIEEIILKVEQEINQEIVELGKQACIDLKVTLPRDLYPYIGRLKYRTSYGQNIYFHSIEVANIAGMLAGEIGSNIDNAKIAGLLHDIGKSIKSNGDGSHALSGAEVVRKYGMDEGIVNAIASHHGEVEPKFVEASLIVAADAISASRPGARRESFEDYIKRLHTLESIATSIEGVDKAYAIQAGREIRIFVNSEQINDETSLMVARDIAKKIEGTMKYPGQIKVTVIRETRVVEYAR
ncbi:MAG: ribonuclease Y [Spirochaetes bacterium GWF1_51_8]|nr:MAG: ribonuclease Y [Spirochaetes bacterium GWF1_51_8]